MLTFVPCCLGLLMRALHFRLPSQQKNVAYNLKYIVHKSPFSRLCLPGLTFKAISLFVHIEIKICRTENNICLLEGLQEHCEQTYVFSCKIKGLSHPFQGLANTKKCVITSPPLSLLVQKKSEFLNSRFIDLSCG